MKNKLWHTFYWKAYHDKIFQEFITEDDITGIKAPQSYHEVFTFDDVTGEPTVHPVQPKELQKIFFIRKNNKNYMLPTIFIDKFPLKPAQGGTFECLEKKSNKVVHEFVKKVTSIKVPADSMGMTFRERIDSFNPVEHSNPKHFTLMKLLAFATAYGGVGVGACSNPNFGKGVNFSILKYNGEKLAILTGPSEALLYQVVSTNKGIIFDEITTTPREKVEMIESAVKKLKDNTPEMPKQALTKGYQKKSADLTQMSVVFTFNRPKDLTRGKPFEEVWGNTKAILSRFPLFLFEGEVQGQIDNPSPHELETATVDDKEFFQEEMKKTKYWVEHIHEGLKGWDRSVLGLKGRHYTNAKSWIDAIEAYCKDEDEFLDMLVELNTMKRNYELMVKGLEPEVPRSMQKYEKSVDEDIL